MSTEPSQIRQNYHPDTEAYINRQINLIACQNYVYLSMYAYLKQDDVANLQGQQLTKILYCDGLGTLNKLIDYQLQRGGRIFLQDIRKPDRDDWENLLNTCENILLFQKSVKQSVLELQKLARDKNDPETEHLVIPMIEKLSKQTEIMGGLITTLRHLGAPEDGEAEVNGVIRDFVKLMQRL